MKRYNGIMQDYHLERTEGSQEFVWRCERDIKVYINKNKSFDYMRCYIKKCLKRVDCPRIRRHGANLLFKLIIDKYPQHKTISFLHEIYRWHYCWWEDDMRNLSSSWSHWYQCGIDGKNEVDWKNRKKNSNR